MKLIMGNDHAAYTFKNTIKTYLEQTRDDIEIIDQGAQTDASVDYPDYAQKVAEAIQNNDADVGVLCCGTGIGMSIKANRYKGIRAALVHDQKTAEMAKAHNNANVLCLGARVLSEEQAKTIIETWLNTSFEEGRHQKRLDKLDN